MCESRSVFVASLLRAPHSGVLFSELALRLNNPTKLRVTRSLVLCVCFVIHCFSFWPFVLRFMDSDYLPLVSSILLNNHSFINFLLSRKAEYVIWIWVDCCSNLNLNLNFWCLMPLSAIFQLYHGKQF